jgi:hypothetical protein
MTNGHDRLKHLRDYYDCGGTPKSLRADGRAVWLVRQAGERRTVRRIENRAAAAAQAHAAFPKEARSVIVADGTGAASQVAEGPD